MHVVETREGTCFPSLSFSRTHTHPHTHTSAFDQNFKKQHLRGGLQNDCVRST